MELSALGDDDDDNEEDDIGDDSITGIADKWTDGREFTCARECAVACAICSRNLAQSISSVERSCGDKSLNESSVRLISSLHLSRAVWLTCWPLFPLE